MMLFDQAALVVMVHYMWQKDSFIAIFGVLSVVMAPIKGTSLYHILTSFTPRSSHPKSTCVNKVSLTSLSDVKPLKEGNDSVSIG